MDNRRPHPHDRSPQQLRFGGHDDPDRDASRDHLRPGQPFGARSDWRGSDGDSRESPLADAGDDRFGGYTGSYAPRGQSDWARSSPWDEDRFGYAEPPRHGREMPSSSNAGYGPQARLGHERSSAFDRADQHHYGGSMHAGPSNFAPRYSGQEFGEGCNSANSPDYRSHRFGQPEGARASFAGGRDSWSRNAGTYRGYGIPSGSEPGGFGMNDPSRSGAQNWSGNNWANDQDWRDGSRHGAFSGAGGRAPKGYTRSDERIRDDVCEQLYRANDVGVSEVTVETKNGTVTLEGTVSDRRMKHRIEDLCEQCIGVNDVDNRIRVVREQPDFSRDGETGNAQSSAAGYTSERASSAKKGTVGSSNGSPH